MVRGIMGQDEHDRIRKALLEYCGLDTLGLVKLLDALRTAASGYLREAKF
jgi:hypothetical protein